VRKFGAWWYWPGYDGPDGARMSSIWRNTPECQADASGATGAKTIASVAADPPETSPAVAAPALSATKTPPKDPETSEPSSGGSQPTEVVTPVNPQPTPPKSPQNTPGQENNGPMMVSSPGGQSGGADSTFRCRELWTQWTLDPNDPTDLSKATMQTAGPGVKFDPDQHFVRRPNSAHQGQAYWAGVPQVQCG